MNSSTTETSSDLTDKMEAENEASLEDAANETSNTEKLQGELKEAQNKYLYLYADFENFKKRAVKERSDHIKFGHESLVRDLIGVSDNLDRALSFATNKDPLVEGLRMVSQQLKETLARYGVSPIEAVGTKFNPEFHEAVAQESLEKVLGQNPSAKEGDIVQEALKGYTLHGRLLRAAKVVVAVK